LIPPDDFKYSLFVKSISRLIFVVIIPACLETIDHGTKI